MRTKESLRVEIRELTKDLATNGMNLRRMKRINNVIETEHLLFARTEILKSIVHRQGLLIEMYDNDVVFGKAAA